MVPGAVVGAYRLLQQIGEGGMGAVWLAEHTMLGRRAAIKLLHPMFTTQPDIVVRFFNEARAATAIADPGIVQIFDFGQHVDGTAYIAMEMLDGEPLDKRVNRLGRLPVADALRILRQIASTLGVAHQRGIIHRDLKPENIYLVRDPEVIGGERAKILDFGIAKLIGDPNTKTNTSAVMGTPVYMSPEQCRGAGQVDQRSDVYALGCMLFKLITGTPPFDADGAGEIIAMHLREPPPALSSRMPGTSPELDALVQHCLAKDPAYRYASGTELAAAIGAVLGASSVPSLPVTGGSVPGMASMAPMPHPSHMAMTSGAAVTTLSSATGAGMAARSARAPRVILLAAVGALLAGGGITAIVMLQSRGAPVSSIVPAGTPPGTPAGMSGPPADPPGPPGPGAVPPPPPPGQNLQGAELARGMKTVLNSFVAWAHDHAGAPCPTAASLGARVQDPWGHPIELTCMDQPAKQIAGAISAGPDGQPGTADDIGSWQLGRDVTDIVRGERWAVAPPPAPAALARGDKPETGDRPSKSDKPAKPDKSVKSDKPVRQVTHKIDNDDIPTER